MVLSNLASCVTPHLNHTAKILEPLFNVHWQLEGQLVYTWKVWTFSMEIVCGLLYYMSVPFQVVVSVFLSAFFVSPCSYV